MNLHGDHYVSMETTPQAISTIRSWIFKIKLICVIGQNFRMNVMIHIFPPLSTWARKGSWRNSWLRGAVVFWFIEFSIQSLFCLCLMAWSLWVVLALLGYTMYSRSLHQRGIFSLNSDAHTKALTRVFLEILIFEYFGYLRLCFDKFFGTDSESPAWRRVKCNPEKLSAKNCFFGGHVTSAWLDGRKGFISRSG